MKRGMSRRCLLSDTRAARLVGELLPAGRRVSDDSGMPCKAYFFVVVRWPSWSGGGIDSLLAPARAARSGAPAAPCT
eukprot:1626640-Pyramimonas_sp.AAC.1